MMNASIAPQRRMSWGMVMCFCVLAALLMPGCDRLMGGEAEGAPAGVTDAVTVTRQSFSLTVISKGELEARNQIEMKNNVEGVTSIVDIVPEGTEVFGPRLHMSSRHRNRVPGSLMITLAVDQIEDRIRQAQEQVLNARSNKTASEENAAIKRSEAESGERDARVRLELAQLDLLKWENGADPQRKRELELEMEKSQRNLEIRDRDVRLSKELYEDSFISLNEYEQSQVNLIEARNALATAKLAISVYEKYTRPQERQRAISNVEQAEDELERTLRRNRSELSRAEADLEIKTRTLEMREQRLAELKQQRRNTRVHAAGDGVVVYATSVGSRHRRGDPLRKGRDVRFNESLIFLPDTSNMVAVLKVHESVIAQVKLGQPVDLTINARPGELIAGTVIFKSRNAEDGGWWNPHLREYVVRVEMPEFPQDTLQPGMHCRGQIHTGHVEDVLALPVQAVHVEGSEQFCYVRTEGGRWARRVVEIGQSSETLVEITAGLREGEQVLLRRPSAGELAS